MASKYQTLPRVIDFSIVVEGGGGADFVLMYQEEGPAGRGPGKASILFLGLYFLETPLPLL